MAEANGSLKWELQQIRFRMRIALQIPALVPTDGNAMLTYLGDSLQQEPLCCDQGSGKSQEDAKFRKDLMKQIPHFHSSIQLGCRNTSRHQRGLVFVGTPWTDHRQESSHYFSSESDMEDTLDTFDCSYTLDMLYK